MTTKKSKALTMLMMSYYFHGRIVTEDEVRSFCDIGHRQLLELRKQLHEQHLLNYRREGRRGGRYTLTQEGMDMLPPDSPTEHRPSIYDDMPHIQGHYANFSEWAEDIMDFLGDEVRFEGIPGREHAVRVVSETLVQADYYMVIPNEDGSITVY